ncbi:hypothetical protein PDL71_03365 [Lacibacter sp. MH-610]|uniref:hypothetical protein n=1 Tax=Lacibacter sp. MH-610 TaxID=3020883 RepID=UPI003891F30A
MKTLLHITFFSLLLLTACRKSDLPAAPIDESVWLNQERGVVVYADFSCDHFVVETFNGYAIVQNWSLRPFTGDVLYGDFSRWGIRDVYNRSRGTLMRVNVRDYWLNYFSAQDRLSWYCSQ